MKAIVGAVSDELIAWWAQEMNKFAVSESERMDFVERVMDALGIDLDKFKKSKRPKLQLVQTQPERKVK